MTNATVTVTNRLPSDTAFAIRQDDRSFAQVFLPSHLVRNGSLQVGSTYDVILTENDEALRDRTPWRVTQLRAEPSVDDIEPSPSPAPAASRDIDAEILALLDEAVYMTTGEITAHIGVGGTKVRDRLLALFNASMIARADVYEKPNLKRASFCLWAADADAFMAGDDE